MRKKSVVWIVALLGIFTEVFGQDVYTGVKGKIEPFTIGIPYDKTVNLIFPYSIRSVDRGSNGVLVQKAKGVENVLQVKAAEEHFNETNLTTITGEGALYSFNLVFDPDPLLMNIKVSEMIRPVETLAILSPGQTNEAMVSDASKRIAAKQKLGGFPKDIKFEMAMRLLGIYIQNDVMYFQIELENSSNISYDVEQFRMYIRDRKRSRRTASQEIEVTPLYIEGNAKHIGGRSVQVLVVAVDKFTIPDKKFLRIELMEQNGGRHLSIKLKNRHLVKARLI